MEFEITFRAFRMGDEKFINALRKNEEMEEKIGGAKRFVSLDREEKWVHDIIMNDNQSVIYFAITDNVSEDIIGYTSISEIDYRNGSCFWSGIKLSPTVSGKGYGFQVALKVLKYAFEELRMVRCIGMCQEDHKVALKLMLKSGYIVEGLMRKFLFKNGKHINEYLLSCTDVDYLNIKNKYSL